MDRLSRARPTSLPPFFDQLLLAAALWEFSPPLSTMAVMPARWLGKVLVFLLTAPRDRAPGHYYAPIIV